MTMRCDFTKKKKNIWRQVLQKWQFLLSLVSFPIYWRNLAFYRRKSSRKLGCKQGYQIHYLCVIFTILVSFSQDNAMHCLPQRLKSTLFEIFCNGAAPKGPAEWEKITNNIDFSFWGNHATTQNTFFDIFKWDQNHENHT